MSRRASVALLAPLGLGISGNCTTATRLSRLVKSHGFDLRMVECSADIGQLQKELASAGIWILLHAYRGGLAYQLVQSAIHRIPDILIFGGTDVNELRDICPEIFQVMTDAVQSVKFCVCFSEAVKIAAVSLWPFASHKIKIISQSVDIPDVDVAACCSECEEEEAPCSGAAKLRPESKDQDALEFLLEESIGDPDAKQILCKCGKMNNNKEQPIVLLLPAGIRKVKNPRYAIELGQAMAVQAVTEMHTNVSNRNSLEVILIITGPPIEDEEAQHVESECMSSLPNFRLLWCSKGVSQDILYQIYQDPRISCVLNTSRSEGQPQAIMEAMLAGGAMVAVSNCSGNIHGAVPTEELGVHLDSMNVLDSAKKLWEVLRDNQQRFKLVAAAKSYAQEHFAGDREGAAYAELFRECLSLQNLCI